MRRIALALLLGLLASAAHAANDWVSMLAADPTGGLVTGRYCYSTNGKDISCDAGAAAYIASDTLFIPTLSTGSIGAGNINASGQITATAVGATLISATAPTGTVTATNGYFANISVTSLTVGNSSGVVGGGTSGRIAYWNGGSSLTSDANFTYSSGLLTVQGISTTTNQASFTTIYASRNVGIGTNNPNNLLHVYGTNSTEGITIDGTVAPGLVWKNAGTTKGYLGLATTSGHYDNNAVANDIVFRTVGGALRFNTNSGAETAALTILGSNGNVGIGTASPNGKLSIGNNVATNFLDTYGEYQVILYDGSTAPASYGLGIKGNTMIFNSGGGAYSFDRGGSASTMTMDTSGNVGIGTSSPAQSSSAGRTYLSLQGSTVDGALEFLTAAADADNNSVGTIQFTDKNSTGADKRVAYIGAGLQGTTANNRGGYIRLLTKEDNGSVLSERVRIDNAGNVGIGTTAPTHALDVYKSSGGAYVGYKSAGSTSGLITGVDASGNGYLWNYDTKSTYLGNANATAMTIDSSNNVGIGTTAPSSSLHINSSGYAAIYLGANGANGFHITKESSDNSFNVWSGTFGAGTNRLKINSSGYVGINNTSPGYNLDVAGTINNNNIISQNGTGPIYHNMQSSAAYEPQITLTGTYNGDASTYIIFGRKRGSSIVQSGDHIGTVLFQGWNGTSNNYLAAIDGMIDSTPGASNDMPGRLVFATTGDGEGSPTERMRITSAGRVGIAQSNPSYILDVTGQARFTGGYTTSDRRLKTNIASISYGLADVMKLKPVFFHWINPVEGEGGRRVGFIAQDVEKIIPELVSTAPDVSQTKSVEYGNMAPVFVKAIQELKIFFDTDHAEVQRLKADNDNLRARLEALEQKVNHR